MSDIYRPLFLRDFPIDRSSLPAPIEYLRRSEVIEALNQIRAMDL